MQTKAIQQILPPPPSHMVGDGFRVHNFFPHGYDMAPNRMSPFYLLDYNAKIEFPPKDTPRGVGVHPHRGFETVTIVYHGKVAHHDSKGNHGVIGEGDIQWMTAASGVLHKEYHEAGFSRKGGAFQVVQLWINLPAKDKMSTPGYQSIANKEIPKYLLPQNKGEVEVIAGTYEGTKGIARTFTPIEMYNIRLKAETTIKVILPEYYNTGILVIEGTVRINEKETAPTDHFILFRNEGEAITLKAMENSILLVLSGEPIKEPIVSYGPFLMNTKDEIMKAYKDLNAGKFGQLED
ncbi:pirin family protein [Gabonibacter chumensis]|uniref:pirin family protein n=1 Tax=Gabonibacter chumensis TaxID=2972474 RepID=UPI00257353AE|nr:pirin family protein [Gabonibacter chumensis]MCR9011931.1 pirin family protein [Gabonibacter chumensis]